MIKRTIEISKEPAYLSLRNDQLRIVREGDKPGKAPSIPCEDIGILIIDHPQTTYSHHALSKLADFGAVVVICGRDHMPNAMMLPISRNVEIVARIRDQIDATQPRCKRIWQQIIKAKVKAQALVLDGYNNQARLKLLQLIDDIRSGDPTNVEAHAARIYWSAWLGESNSSFRRMQTGRDPLNSFLNYGYAVLRAAVARAIVIAGLVPAIGINHSNRSNAFALADDLVEPLRPLVDVTARHLHEINHDTMNATAKIAILELLTATVHTGDETGPLLVHLHRYTASLIRCLRGEDKKMEVPEINFSELSFSQKTQE